MHVHVHAGRDARLTLDFRGSQRSRDAQGAVEPPTATAEEFLDASLGLLSWPREIDGRFIPRPELAVIEEMLERIMSGEDGARSVLLFGPPGSGKSALLGTLADDLAKSGACVLGIKADMLPPSLRGVAGLGEELGLEGDLVQELQAQAAIRPVYVVIDQLDAVASLIDGSGDRLRTLTQLARRLRRIPNIAVVASVRRFEFEADGAFRGAFPPDAVQIVELALPGFAEVEATLRRAGIDPAEVPAGLRQALRTPQALLDVVSARKAGFSWDVVTSWRRAQTRRFGHLVRLNPSLPFERVVERLIEAQRSSGSLWTEEAGLPVQWHPAVERLRAEHILRREEGRGLIGFAHQTWAETLDARLALANGDIVGRVNAAGRNLLARPQALGLLRFARDDAPAAYGAAIAELWADPGLRRHLRHLVLDLAAGNESPTDSERRIVARVVAGDDASLADRALRMTRGNEAWFAQLRGPVSDRMASSDEQRAWSVVFWLAGAASGHSEEVVGLLQRHWEGVPDRAMAITVVLESLTDWDGRSFDLYRTSITLVPEFRHPHAAVIRSQAKKGRHVVAARLLGIAWDRLADLSRADTERRMAADPDPEPNDEDVWTEAVRRRDAERQRSFAHSFSKRLGETSGFHGFKAFTEVRPAPYIETLLPRLAALVPAPDDRPRRSIARDFWELHAFGRGHGDARSDFAVPLIEATVVALRELAKNDPSTFAALVEVHQGTNRLLDRLFALAFAHAASLHREAALAFLGESPDRLALGDPHHDDQADTVRLVAALTTVLDADGNDRLVDVIRRWDRFVVDDGDDRRSRRSLQDENRAARGRLVAALDPARLSPAARRYFQEEMRAVPEGRRTHRRRGIRGGATTRITADNLALARDEQILALFRRHPAVDPEAEWSDTVDVARREASYAFDEFSRAHPERALGLVEQFSPATDQGPAGDALRNAAGAGAIDAERVLAALDRALRRGFDGNAFLDDATHALSNLALRTTGLDDRWYERLLSWFRPPAPPFEPAPIGRPPAKDAVPTSVVFGQGSTHGIGPSSNYAIMHAVTYALMRRDPPAWSEWIGFLLRRLDEADGDADWMQFCRHLVHLHHADPARAADLLLRLFRSRPAVRDSQDGAVLVAQLISSLPKEAVDEILAAWRVSDWSLASVAIGEISALRAVFVGLEFSIDGWLVRDGGNEGDPDILAGVANFAVEYWNDDDAGRRTWARRVFKPLAARRERRIATVCASIFDRVAPWPHEDDVRQLMRVLAGNPAALDEIRETSVDDRLGEILEDATFHEAILDFIDGLVDATIGKLADHSTAGPMLADGLLPIVLTIHRDREFRERTLTLFEKLLDDVPGATEEALGRLDPEPTIGS